VTTGWLPATGQGPGAIRPSFPGARPVPRRGRAPSPDRGSRRRTGGPRGTRPGPAGAEAGSITTAVAAAAKRVAMARLKCPLIDLAVLVVPDRLREHDVALAKVLFR
jgi:hypothetical protein